MCIRHNLLTLAAIMAIFLLLAPVTAGSKHPPAPRRGNEAIMERLPGNSFQPLKRPNHTGSLPVIRVTTTSDAGPGSFRQAILDANGHIGGDSIVFNIPKTDPGYNSLIGVWTIKPLSSLPTLTDDGTIIDGESQALFSPGSNPLGPSIVLDGSLGGPAIYGLSIWCSWTFVHKLAINSMSEMGIYIAGSGHSFNLIDRCYIGVTPDGKNKAPNLGSGIVIADASLNFISWPDTTFSSFANVIGGNGGAGIEMTGTGSSLNYVGPNCIGTDLSRTIDLGNTGDGIAISMGASDNSILNVDSRFIIIRNNKQAGIRVSGSSTVRNLLAAGSITNNGGPGILLENGGNGYISSPTITSVEGNTITATASPNNLIFFYRDLEDEGEEFLGQAYTDAAGKATYSGAIRGPYITALAVDTTTGVGKNNTSAFSDPYQFLPYIEVNNTRDSGPGSLRAAIDLANSHKGSDFIKFAIPTSDPGYSPALGTWTIKPASPLPSFSDRGTMLMGSTQNEFMGYDVNPHGPEIELDGSLAGPGGGLFLNTHAPGTMIENLAINRFATGGIVIDGTDTAWVIACYIGTDARGLQSAPNDDGVVLHEGAKHIYVGWDQGLNGNLISGNTGHGINCYDSCSENRFVGNTIGLNRTRTMKLANGSAGIAIDKNSTAIEVSDNWIGGNSCGILINGGSNSFLIAENMIGTDTTCRWDLGNLGGGVLVFDSQQGLISMNRIAFNVTSGVLINGPAALYNTISRNWICHHSQAGILNSNGGNAGYACPVIQSLSAGTLTGTAQAYDHIEAFTDSADEGGSFLGSAHADASGHWSMTQMAALGGRFITATATDTKGNTSRFSAPFDYIAADVAVAKEDLPRAFSLEQNYPNPFNPSTRIQYTVGGARDEARVASGKWHGANVKLAVYDLLGREVAVLVDEKKAPGNYVVRFDGSGLASGVYVYRLTAGTFVLVHKMILAK